MNLQNWLKMKVLHINVDAHTISLLGERNALLKIKLSYLETVYDSNNYCNSCHNNSDIM